MTIYRKIELLADQIWELAYANRMTGIWDNRRQELCRPHWDVIDDLHRNWIYRSEKKSRANVEKRAKCRNEINRLLKEVILDTFK